jgi:hypothetical protein
MAGSLHYIPLKQREYLSSPEVMTMSDAAQGVNMRLLCFYWDKGRLPTETLRLAALVGRERRVFDRLWVEIAPLWREVDGGLEPTFLGLSDERAEVVEKVEKNRNRKDGQQGGRPRGGNRLESGLKANGFKPGDELETGWKHISETELDKKVITPLLDPVASGTPQGERAVLDEEKFDAFFRRFRDAYPKRGDGNYKWPKTRTALYGLLATRAATAGAIMKGLLSFKAWAESGRNKDTDYIPLPTTWLDDSGWLDEYPVVLKAVDGGKAPTKTPAQMRAELDERMRLADGGR